MIAKIPFKKDAGIRFWEYGGTAEHDGEKISYRVDTGCGIGLSYKGKTYRIEPGDIVGAVIDAIDGTHEGKA